jgi:hypothetical protein
MKKWGWVHTNGGKPSQDMMYLTSFKTLIMYYKSFSHVLECEMCYKYFVIEI